MVVIVAVPVLVDPVTMNVREEPETAGVTLTPESTPEVKAPEVPVIPAVPLYETVETKLVTVLLLTSWAVRVIPVMAVPAVWGEEMVDIAKWSKAPAEKVMFPLVTAVRVTPPEAVAVKVITSAIEYTGVAIVTLFAPIPMLPATTPDRVPPPEPLPSVIVVAFARFDGLL